MTQEAMLDFIHRMQAEGGDCIVCSARTQSVDLYQPADPVADGLGQPEEGKQRVLPVYLCQKHVQDAYTFEIVEQIIRMKARAYGQLKVGTEND